MFIFMFPENIPEMLIVLLLSWMFIFMIPETIPEILIVLLFLETCKRCYNMLENLSSEGN